MEVQRRGILVHPEDLTAEWLNWMLNANLNSLGLHPAGGANAALTLENAIREHTLPATRSLIRYAGNAGITVEYEAHAISWLLPRSLFNRVPDWFRMDENGQRTSDVNLCASSEEALAYVADRAALLAELLNTGSDRYYFWLDDVKGGFCHCPDCRALSVSDQHLKITNAILTGLRHVNHNAKLCYLAYFDAMDAPRRIKPLEGVFLEYAPMRRNFQRPIDDPDCAENVAETARLGELLSLFGKKDAKVLEYWMDNSMYSHWTKPPKQFHLNEALMRRDVAYYVRIGFSSLTSFGCYLGPDYQKLYGLPPICEYGRALTDLYPPEMH